MTPAEIRTALDNIDKLLKSINDFINGQLANLVISHIPGVSDILRFLHDRVADISHQLERIVGQVKDAIGTAIGAIVPTALDFLVGIVNDVFNDVHSILGNLATAEEFVGGALNEIKRQFPKVGETVLGWIGGGLVSGLVGALQLLEGQDRNTVDHFLDTAIDKLPKDHFLYSMLHGLKSRGAEWQALALPLLVGVMLQPIGEAMANPFLEILKQTANADVASGIATPPDLIEQRIKGAISIEQFHGDMRKNNIDAAHADQMVSARYSRLLPEEINTLRFRNEISIDLARSEAEQQGVSATRLDFKLKAQQPLLSEDEIRQTFLRGIIDRPKHDALMSMHGYTQETINNKVNLYYLIPGPQDLIHMGIRNVFDPQIVERFNLSQDAPKEFFHAAAQQGISQDWALKFWEAHWIVPGIDQAFEMFQRVVDKSEDPSANSYRLLDGTIVQNIIGRDTLNLFLKDKDVPPYYRAKLAQVAYKPLNRIDVRRMYSVGSLTKAGVERAYLNLGYAPDNARLLADFVERYYAQSKKDKAQPIVDGLRRQILRLYQEEKLELSDASFALTDLNFTKEEADLYLSEVKLVRQAEDATQLEAGIGRIFTRGFIDEPTARARLAKASVPQAAIDRLLNKWNLTIEFNRDSEHFHKQRDLTKSEVSDALAAGMMSEDDALGFYEFLGYPPNEARIEVALARYRQGRQARTAQVDALKALMVNGIRDTLSISNSLDALGIPAAQRDALLAEWTLARETRTERIPIATLRDMVRGQFLSADDAFVHLKRHRFTDDDADLLLSFWGQTPPQGGRKRGKGAGG